ncbi:hypothetical protein C8Q76DRAFT_685792 [Earliella scabrosa]|nr:hypothetical protein C8Q76DRAFT_685792 [Earliella scabrosa]
MPGHGFALSRHKSDEGDDRRERVDGAFFQDGRVPTNGAPNWPDQDVSVEFKRESRSNDPFHDLKDGKVMDAPALTRISVRGQKISYAEHILAVQHRTGHFSLIVMGRFYRAIYWERSGSIVTPRVNYVAHPEGLCEILRRLGSVEPAVLGHDPYATRLEPTDEDYVKMTDFARPRDTDFDFVSKPAFVDPSGEDDADPEHTYVRDAFRTSITADPLWPRYRLSIPQPDGSMHKCLVGKPTFVARGLVGRGTRGYVALDCSTNRFVFLKDAWRANYRLLEREGDILAKLNDTSDNQTPVLNVPTLVCHGDIGGQKTKTPGIWEALNNPPEQPDLARPSTNPFRLHMHYRIVVKEVGMPLSSFRNGKELVTAIYDCLEAHYMALKKSNILHRDISAGNILLYPKLEEVVDDNDQLIGRTWVLGGMLTDWELAKCITIQYPRQPERTGTWQFMSAASLLEPGKALEVADEVESLLHVTIYHAIRYLHHNCRDVYTFMTEYFDQCSYDGSVPLCGKTKYMVMWDGELVQNTVPIVFRSKSSTTPSHPLNDIITDMLERFRARYRARRLAKQSVLPNEPPRPTSSITQQPGVRTRKKASHMDLSAVSRPRGRAAAPATSTLSEQDKELAKSIETHAYFGDLLLGAINDLSWPTDDKHGDHLALVLNDKKKKRALEERGDMADVFGAGSKRFRTSSSSWVSGEQVVETMHTVSWAADECTDIEEKVEEEKEEEEIEQVERELSVSEWDGEWDGEDDD